MTAYSFQPFVRRMAGCFLACLMLYPGLTAAQASDAQAIFEEVERRQEAVETESVTIQMDIIDGRGRTRSRTMQTRTKQGDGLSKSLLVFTEPADIRGMGLLTLETEGADDQRLFLPSLQRVQRIAGSARSERFAGSDFTYEDLGTYDPDEYDVSLAETTPDTWLLEARPLDPESQYSRILFEVDRMRYVLVRARYFDQQDALAKVLTAEAFSEIRPDVWRADRLVMEDVQEQRKTVLTFSDRQTGEPMDDALFTERQLRRGLR